MNSGKEEPDAKRAVLRGIPSVDELLNRPALRDLEAGIGRRLLVVTPGIRPAGARPKDDQKRTVDVAQAFATGADYIVVGRPVRADADPPAGPGAVQSPIAAGPAG